MGRVQNVWPTLVMLVFDVFSFWHFTFSLVRLQTLQLIFRTAKRLIGVHWLWFIYLASWSLSTSTANVTRCIMVSVTVPSWLPSTPPCPHTLTTVQQQSYGFTDCYWVNWVALNFSLNFKEACFSCLFGYVLHMWFVRPILHQYPTSQIVPYSEAYRYLVGVSCCYYYY